MRLCLAAVVSLSASLAWADPDPRIDAIVQTHILPRVAYLSDTAEALNSAAQADCRVSSAPLQQAYHQAFDAWIGVSHLRFGPIEAENRGFALAFWPDSRGATPKTLTALITSADPVVGNAEDFATVSIAGRGFYALDYLLFDPRLSQLGAPGYHCALIRAIAGDIDLIAADIARDWQGYATLMQNPGTGPYQSETEVLQELFKALTTGLEINSAMRLGRPMGQPDKPRPKRAEAWRSGRSLQNLTLSLMALQELAALLSDQDPAMDRAFGRALDRAKNLQDPVFAGVSDPMGRLRIEALQQRIADVQTRASQDLGPALGVAAGFNSLDGD